MIWLQIRLFGPYFSSFSTNSYGYYSQKSQNLFSNGQIFASAQIVRQAASALTFGERARNFTGEYFRARGYFVSTVGRK
jgi:hypothetical protein